MSYPTVQTVKLRQFMENILNNKDSKRKHSFDPVFNDIFYLEKRVIYGIYTR